MEDSIPDLLLEQVGQRVAILQLAFDQPEEVRRTVKLGQVLALAVRKVIQHPHFVPVRQQSLHDPAANEPGSAGNQYLHAAACSAAAGPSTPISSRNSSICAGLIPSSRSDR